jgi:hypothetical protein
MIWRITLLKEMEKLAIYLPCISSNLLKSRYRY